jgi:DNA-directed RNA polymerase beta subunit
MDLQKVTIGSKITGRYGNKGCVSLILEDDEMPVIQSGRLKVKRPHIIMNPLGITGRMNPCCLQEQELNFVGLYERDYLKNDCKTLQAKIDDLIEYYEVVSPHQVDNLVNFIETHMDEQVEKLIQEYIETGIPIHQGPFYPNNDIYDMAKIYEYMENKLGLDDLSCKFEGIHEKLVIGEMYFVILKHNYSNKSSARSTSFNDLKDLPAKDKKYKENESIISTTPIKIGEMERTVLQAGIGNEKYVKELYYSHSTNYEDRENFEEELLTGNPFKTEFELSGTESNAVEVLKQLMYCSGVEFEDDDNENNEEVELYVEE